MLHRPLSALLLMYEMSRGKTTTGRVREWLEGNTGFLFLYTRRYQFLILCAHLFVRRLRNYPTVA
jgi:hypothetical protein